MPFQGLNREKRLYINLSHDAIMIMQNDMGSFRVKSRATFINQVIKNYKQEAEASILLAAETYREGLEERLERQLSEFDAGKLADKDKFVDAMVKEYMEDIKRRNREYEKGEGFKFRLNKENEEYLYDIAGGCEENIPYNGSCGEYVKALLEEYCRKEFVEREMIYAKALFDEISDAIALKRMVKATLVSGDKAKIEPYAIKTDLLSMYHYVVGYEYIQGENGETQKKSFSSRITNLKEIHRLKEPAVIFREEFAEDRKKLDSEIRSKGAQFMCEDIMRYKIYFTDKGIQLYNRMLHLRPAAVKISKDGHTYTFECSQKQIEFYIFKFGADAVVLSPESLKNKFLQKYQDAINAYSSYS